ncbi:unnamed protein product [Amoebophrya sp. A25]|nr:unnamed protein product [Amoebophrya sp. A25]|eukprot:GSA25T00023421001.1
MIFFSLALIKLYKCQDISRIDSLTKKSVEESASQSKMGSPGGGDDFDAGASSRMGPPPVPGSQIGNADEGEKTGAGGKAPMKKMGMEVVPKSGAKVGNGADQEDDTLAPEGAAGVPVVEKKPQEATSSTTPSITLNPPKDEASTTTTAILGAKAKQISGRSVSGFFLSMALTTPPKAPPTCWSRRRSSASTNK